MKHRYYYQRLQIVQPLFEQFCVECRRSCNNQQVAVRLIRNYGMNIACGMKKEFGISELKTYELLMK